MNCRFELVPETVNYAPGCVKTINEELARLGFSEAIFVTDKTVRPTSVVVDAVAELRDALGLTTRWDAIEDVSGADPPGIARDVEAEPALARVPNSFDPTAGDLEDAPPEIW